MSDPLPVTGPIVDPIAQLASATEVVRRAIEAGLLNPQALGLAAGVTVDALEVTAAPMTGPQPGMVPGTRITMQELAEKTLAGLTESTRGTYEGYIDFLVNGWRGEGPEGTVVWPGLGDLWADEVLPSQLEEGLRAVEARAMAAAAVKAANRRAAGRFVHNSTASGAKYNAVGAWRRVFKTAVKDRHLARAFDPSQEIDKPKRIDGTRLALEQAQLDELWAVCTGTGDDPVLDEMIVETILVAGARKEGILNLTLGGLDHAECTIRLDEKNSKVVHQPVPDWFVAKLHAFALDRGASALEDAVFRRRGSAGRPGKKIGSRRFDYLFQDRVQARLEWADKEKVTAHTLRHHAISVVERTFGRSVAIAFARHEPEDVNGRYTVARPREVATAVIAIYGGDHPWLHREPRPRTD
jgi:site-specific recombinase XerC